MKKHIITDRPKSVQIATRKTWSPSTIRNRFILPNERELFNGMYDACPESPNHKLDKIVYGPQWEFMSRWVKSRFTCLGKDWEVGTILIKDRPKGRKTWWFMSMSTCMPDGTYNPLVVPYKYIIAPLQVNHTESLEEFSKLTYYTTNYHYVKNNQCMFKLWEDYYQSSNSNWTYNYGNDIFDKVEKIDPNSETPEWYHKYELPQYTDEMDKKYLEHNLDIELPYTWVPGSVLITDATRIYGFKTGIDGVDHKRLLSIMTYKKIK